MAPSISVVIPSFRGARRLPRTLESLVGSDVPGGLEVIVVDDGSGDGTAEAAGGFEGRLALKVISFETNRGRSAAANAGIRAAAGRIVLILDDDMEAGPGLVRRHLEAHPAGARIGALGRIVHEGLDPRRAFQAFLLREEEWRRRRLMAGGEIGFGEVWTGQFSVERDLAREAGMFDEAISIYGLEDIEFAYRLSRCGTQFVYLDDAVSRHAPYAVDLDRYCQRHRLVGEVAAYVARRHDSPEMRRYLRVEAGPVTGRRSPFNRLMDLSAAILRRRSIAAFLAGPFAHPLLRGGVRLLEAAHLRRPLSFAYSFLRDVQYFNALGLTLALEAERRGDGTGQAR